MTQRWPPELQTLGSAGVLRAFGRCGETRATDPGSAGWPPDCRIPRLGGVAAGLPHTPARRLQYCPDSCARVKIPSKHLRLSGDRDKTAGHSAALNWNPSKNGCLDGIWTHSTPTPRLPDRRSSRACVYQVNATKPDLTSPPCTPDDLRSCTGSGADHRHFPAHPDELAPSCGANESYARARAPVVRFDPPACDQMNPMRGRGPPFLRPNAERMPNWNEPYARGPLIITIVTVDLGARLTLCARAPCFIQVEDRRQTGMNPARAGLFLGTCRRSSHCYRGSSHCYRSAWSAK